jgi:hypothetical protein
LIKPLASSGPVEFMSEGLTPKWVATTSRLSPDWEVYKMVAPGTEVLVTGVGVSVGGLPVEVGSVVTVGSGEALRVGKGTSVETGLVVTGRVISGLTMLLPGVLPGWDGMVGS